MRPRTRQQQLVYGMSVQLPKLEEKLKYWAFDNCIDHIGYRTKNSTSCLSCGHKWKGHSTNKTEECPSCKRKLIIKDTRVKKNKQLKYFAVLEVKGDFQLNRYFQLRTYHKFGEAPTFYCWEVAQQWMREDGKHEVVAMNRGGMGYYMSDSFHGSMEIRDRTSISDKYNIYPHKIYPGAKVLPIYKRNGFKGKHGDSTPFDIFSQILWDSMAETLLKAKQFGLLDARISKGGRVSAYWSSIKICIRNKYLVKDAGIWLDYMNLLYHFRKDLHNAKYVCPKNLMQEHDKLVAKKRELDRIRDEERQQRDLEQKRKRLEHDREAYLIYKAPYFGLVFSKGDLTIKVLESVQEFQDEGDFHKHCVFTNAYYSKENSLVFSARVKGIPVETVEVSLVTMKVLQSRGLNNQNSEYHEEILALMEANMLEIERRRRSVKKEAA